MLKDQFIGKTFHLVLAGIFSVHLLSFFIRGTAFEPWILLVIGLAALVLSWKNLRTGLMLAFAELFVGGHGHLLHAEVGDLPVISLRIALFAAVMLAWLGLALFKKRRPKWSQWRDIPWAILAVVVAVAGIQGFLFQSAGFAFDDANGYLFIAYLLPIISVKWSGAGKRDWLQVLGGSVAWMAGFTLLLSYLFTHLPGKMLAHLYTFVRDARLAEVTLQVLDNGAFFYRVFMQSQFYLLIGIFLVLAFLWMKKKAILWQEFTLLAILGAAAWISLSRSFLIGFAGGIILLTFFAWKTRKSWGRWFGRGMLMATALFAGIAIATLTVVIPLPERPDLTDASFYQTSADTGREAGVASRWALLTPMMETIYDRPIFGSGFGTEVTYTTDDPRIIEETGGEYTTYRFEWGYQDIWLKMGLFGLIAFAILFYAYWRALKSSGKNQLWLAFGFAAGMVFLFAAHIFSPYLNHPIGLGYLLFITPFLRWEKKMEFDPLKGRKIEIAVPKARVPIVTSGE
jgi:O-antigen ligase